MTEHTKDLAGTKLFCGINENDIADLLGCVQARVVRYKKGDMIIKEGDKRREFGIMLSGHARSTKWDASDKLVIITLLKKGSEIGVLLAANPEHESTVFVEALDDDVAVLMIPYNRLLSQCNKNCSRHERMLKNYIGVVAEKGLVLHERINCLLKPTIRSKITTYLLRIAQDKHERTFTLPVNRNGMAEYLNVERSALSRELSRMKHEGLIDYHREDFRLLDL